jgi:hypothetical protein
VTLQPLAMTIADLRSRKDIDDMFAYIAGQ